MADETGPVNGRRLTVELRCSCTALLMIDYVPPIQIGTDLCDLAKQWSKEHSGCAARNTGKVTMP